MKVVCACMSASGFLGNFQIGKSVRGRVSVLAVVEASSDM